VGGNAGWSSGTCDPNCVANDADCVIIGGDSCCNGDHSCTIYVRSDGTMATKCQTCAARGEPCTTTGSFDRDCCNSDDSCVNGVCTQTCNNEFQACTNGLPCCRNADVCYDDTCQYCIDDDQPCEQAGVAYPADCCDPDRTCTKYAFDFTYKCRECLARGAFCHTGSNDVQCCGDDACENNICTENCVAFGDSCFMEPCCDGKQCRNFVCQDPCLAEGVACFDGFGDPCCDGRQCIGGICQDAPTCVSRGDACSTGAGAMSCCLRPGSTIIEDVCVNNVCVECVLYQDPCTSDAECCTNMFCDGGACNSAGFFGG